MSITLADVQEIKRRIYESPNDRGLWLILADALADVGDDEEQFWRDIESLEDVFPQLTMGWCWQNVWSIPWCRWMPECKCSDTVQRCFERSLIGWREWMIHPIRSATT